MNIIITFFVAYILGSIPISYIMGKLIKGIDIRDFGSGNVGATNALRILGTKVGVFTLIMDIGKGFLAVNIARLIIHQPSDLILIITGLFAILGHIFTIFLKFKGGKGVATSAGVFIALVPIPMAIALFVFIITVWLSKFVSLGSILAALTLFISELVINIRNSFAELEILIFIIIVVLFIIIRHKSNIQRLIKGNENKISFKKK
ncbi:MAG: glycerol-3-phosphate 1-O-acyltransferase PlsY [Candidatus Cloacimonetes bacterium]|jgi:glycerol-3-phosphate acyltransferase PlsY|nr:glycerol-3-phosphate 1-O-acyltransferase PlsY [Candidatus Cloacimonadota bacterium]